MSKLVICDCGKTFDSSQGHICGNGRWIQGTMNRNNITIPMVDDQMSSTSQNFHSFPVEQRNQPISTTTELGNANEDYFMNSSLSNLETHSHVQLDHSSQACETGGISSDMIITSLQAYSEGYAWSASNNEAVFHHNELLTHDYDPPMRQSFRNFQQSWTNSELPAIDCQFRMNQDNLSTPPNSESYNKYTDFTKTNTFLQQMPTNEFRTVNALQDFQTPTNIENDQFKLINNQIEVLPGCDNYGVSKTPEVIEDHWNRRRNEIVMGNLREDIMAVGNIQLTDINRHFCKHGQNTQEMWIDYHFGNITDDFFFKEVEPISCSMVSDIHAANTTYDTSAYTVPPNNQARLNATNAEDIQYECTSASAEYQNELKDTNLVTCREESAVKGFARTGQSESVVDHSIRKVHAVAGPSRMYVNECSFPVSIEGNQQNVVHTAEKSFTCNLCQKRFARKDYLKKHVLIHSGVKPYKCEKCGKSFIRKSTLHTHELIHLGAKPFTCNFCKNRFRHKFSLLNHMSIHDGSKPYLCEICGKSYRLKSLLENHILSHGSEKLFECQYCGKRYWHLRNLYRHKEKHKPY